MSPPRGAWSDQELQRRYGRPDLLGIRDASRRIGADTLNVTVNTTAVLKGARRAHPFAALNGIALTGTVDGETGANTLDLSAYTISRSVVLTGSNANGFGGTDGVTSGFAGIYVVVGGSGADTLTGDDVAATWTLAAIKTYNYGTAALLLPADLRLCRVDRISTCSTWRPIRQRTSSAVPAAIRLPSPMAFGSPAQSMAKAGA